MVSQLVGYNLVLHIFTRNPMKNLVFYPLAVILLSACAITNPDTSTDTPKPKLVLDNAQPTLTIAALVENSNAADEAAFEIKNDGFLINAASDGNLEAVRAFIEEGTDVNARSRRWTTPLIASSNSGHTDVVQLLIDSGATVDSRSFTSWPLMAAVKKSYTDIIKILLAANADTELRDRNGRTPLMHAIEKGDFEIVKLLVESGADVNVVSSEDDPTSPLVLAINYGRPEIVTHLVKSGAKPIHPMDDKPILHHVQQRQRQLSEIVQLFNES